eukprot:TCALIF_03605-PA protein Name:"Protein of unknown function" AED:0.32 eAED:0.32 QI:0/0/0/0.66/0/0/3/0/103
MCEPFFDEPLVIAGTCLVVPCPVRLGVFDWLHLSPLGISKTISLANQLFLWPGMAHEVKQSVTTCHICQPFASFLMQHVSVDLFDLEGTTYLVMMYRYASVML